MLRTRDWFSLLLPLGCFCIALLLGLPGAMCAPDSAQYRLLAFGQRASVPAPFSARILGPAIAGWLGKVSGLGVDTGFLALGIVCLALLIALIACYFWSWRAPIAIFAAVFLMPFWVDLFHDYYLPDLLDAVLLAAMLACLYYGYTGLGLLLLLPACLARESTILVAFCLILAGWRLIPLRPAVVGVLALVSGRLLSAHYGEGSAATVHGLSGGAYILGKISWSFSRNVLGLPLWSNTLPECNPIWVSTLPGGGHWGAIRMVGLCQPSLWGPGRLALAWFGVFGLGPACALSLRQRILQTLYGRADVTQVPGPGALLVFRFCLIYGVMSILMTPLLGASVDRLGAYGWPFYFVLLPWFVHRYGDLPGLRVVGLAGLHIVTCWLAWFAFRQETAGYVLAGAGVLAANGLGYFILRRSRFGYLSA